MKQIEVTTFVKDTLDVADTKLKKHGFSIIRKSRVEDKYMISNTDGLTEKNILEYLKKCVLIRHVNVFENINGDTGEFKNFTFKKKEYDRDNILSEEKVCIKISDDTSLYDAERLFLLLGFENLVNVNYDVVVYENDGTEFAFQDVENLGLLLEYESLDDFSDASSKEILDEKKKMLDFIKSCDLDVHDCCDVKKAYELVKKERKF